MDEKQYILIDEKIANNFQRQAKQLTEYPKDAGMMRVLKEKLMDLCGVTELEAHNILIGRNVGDYILKYEGQRMGKTIEAKEYQGEIQVVYTISEDEKDLFGWK